MSLKIPDAGELLLLGYLRTQLNAGCVLRLFVNDKTPADSDTAGAYTEASFSGYTPTPLSSFAAPVTVGGVAQINANPVTWTAGAGASQLVYGYYVTDAGGNLLWAERDPAAPVPMNRQGNSYTVQAQLTLHTEF